jgi:hypothetical protein
MFLATGGDAAREAVLNKNLETQNERRTPAGLLVFCSIFGFFF